MPVDKQDYALTPDDEEYQQKYPLYDEVLSFGQFQDRLKDNLFNADHRNQMLNKHQGTEAQIIKIDEL